MTRFGIFKYRIDAWPVSVLGVTTLLSLLPFLVPLPFWALALAWVGVIYLRTFCPFIQHNHAHLPVFKSDILNRMYDTVLTQNTGYPSALWELHHNRGHHRNFLEPDKDVAALTYPGTQIVMSRFMYALRGNLTIHRDSIKIGIAEGLAGKKTLLAKLAIETMIQTAITLALLIWHPLLTLSFFVVPNIFSAWMIWWESYPHHLNVPMTSKYDASVTLDKPLYNLLTFNIGHHTAHHEKPTLHWSLLPNRTEEIRHLIPESCIQGIQKGA